MDDDLLQKKFDTWQRADLFARNHSCAVCLGKLRADQNNAIVCDNCGPSCDANIISNMRAHIVERERSIAGVELRVALAKASGEKFDEDKLLSELGF